MRSPVSWVGNKLSILHIIYALFPLKYNRYVEPFGGSGTVLLGKKKADNFEVYNDYNRNLVNLFHCIKDRTLALIRELGFMRLNSRDDFAVLKRFFEKEEFRDDFLKEELELSKIMLDEPKADEICEMRLNQTKDYDVRRGAAFLKLIRYSYSSGCKSYASQPFDIARLFNLIWETCRRFANVVIENQDFETLIRHYDRKDTFFYLDPPYYATEDMYEAEFRREDHERLCKLLKTISGKFLLSYNDCSEIRELYKDCWIFDFKRIHSMAQRYEAGKEFPELLIANYDIFEREREFPFQINLFNFDEYTDHKNYMELLKENIICRKKN